MFLSVRSVTLTVPYIFSGVANSTTVVSLDHPYSKKHVAGDDVMNSWVPGKGKSC